ncbi:MAG: AmmeMemoRadiSam system protein B [Bacillota bacterium]|nr:AmmeMemoRadiSam system protein B [Bacillota bacterium]
MNKLIMIFVSLAVLLSGCTLSVDSAEKEELENSEVVYDEEETGNDIEYKSIGYNNSLFYDSKNFYSTIPKEVDVKLDGVRGIICTHHLLASELLHEVFQAVEDRDNYDSVVIVGPDHNTVDSKNIYTTNLDWLTPFGDVKIDNDKLEILKEYPGVTVDNALMEIEHSNAALMHFVSYYFKNAKVVNIAIPGTLDKEESLAFSHYLDTNILDKNTLLIASIDFSHYLEYDRANAEDEETLEAIINKDYNSIMEFDNDNVDSPQSLISILRFAENNNLRFNLLNNKNSYDIIPVDKHSTTSYFSIIYN